MTPQEKLELSVRSLRSMTDFKPKVMLILGSGLGDFADTMDVVQTIDYKDIEGFPVSSVSGHAGCLVFGYISGVSAVAMRGRVHYYEGYDMTDVVLPLRAMRMLGASELILTNAAGGINPEFRVGDFMLLSDHISSFVPSPLRGKNFDGLGLRFPDMTGIYDADLRATVHKCADELGIHLRDGVYLQTTGPQYESPAEIRMFRALGADAVGMSTACEAIAARHAGYRICGMSLITNAAAGMSDTELSHEEVKLAADAAAEKFTALLHKFISSAFGE